jgi:bifunctional NMN adenylyltransferase/nudix hydrolase
MNLVRHDDAILIGRFQPFHNGHAALLKAALEMAERVLVVLGSAGCARNARNPFTWEERAAMIGASLDASEARRVSFVPIRDHYDDKRWAAAVVNAVRARQARGKAMRRVALVGFHKDASGDYLRLFPDWTFVALERQGEIDATVIRRAYFGDEPLDMAACLPEAVVRYLDDWSRQPAHAALQAEHRAIETYREKWGAGPFVTVDALVTAARHVLLIRRGRYPGKGSWALPGGFLEGRERLLQGAIRELREETRLEASAAELEAALCATAVFDHPDRSQRGRVITHVHHFALTRECLPAVVGADDAAEAHWHPLGRLPALEAECFEDHFHILDHFLKIS